jgi:cell division protein FtsX
MVAPKKWLLVMMTTAVLSVCFIFVMSLYLVSKTIHLATTDAQKNIKLEMFFREDLNEENIKWVDSLKNKFEIQDIHLVSKAEAQNLFVDLMRKDWGALAEDKTLLSQLPSSVVIQFQDDLGGQKVEQVTENIVTEALQFENYDSHIFQKDWAQWFSSYKNFSRQAAIYSSVFVGLLIFLIISNLNRSLIFQHLKEIEVLHLLGATRWQITRPFLLKSLGLGAVSTMASYFVINLLIEVFKKKSFESGQLIPLEKLASINWVELVIFLSVTLLISLYSAQVCVRDQLR